MYSALHLLDVADQRVHIPLDRIVQPPRAADQRRHDGEGTADENPALTLHLRAAERGGESGRHQHNRGELLSGSFAPEVLKDQEVDGKRCAGRQPDRFPCPRVRFAHARPLRVTVGSLNANLARGWAGALVPS